MLLAPIASKLMQDLGILHCCVNARNCVHCFLCTGCNTCQVVIKDNTAVQICNHDMRLLL